MSPPFGVFRVELSGYFRPTVTGVKEEDPLVWRRNRGAWFQPQPAQIDRTRPRIPTPQMLVVGCPSSCQPAVLVLADPSERYRRLPDPEYLGKVLSNVTTTRIITETKSI